MISDARKIGLILGATGATGSLLVTELVGSGVYGKLHIVHYKPTQMVGVEGTVEHVIDLKKFNLEIEGPVHDVFCTIGTTRKKAGSAEKFIEVDKSYVLNLGKWAKEKGVQSFHVISSVGARQYSPFLYMRTKGEMEQGLRDLELPALVIYRPPLLHAPNRSEFRPMERLSYHVLQMLTAVQPFFFKHHKPLSVVKLAHIIYKTAQQPLSGMHVLQGSRLRNC